MFNSQPSTYPAIFHHSGMTYYSSEMLACSQSKLLCQLHVHTQALQADSRAVPQWQFIDYQVQRRDNYKTEQEATSHTLNAENKHSGLWVRYLYCPDKKTKKPPEIYIGHCRFLYPRGSQTWSQGPKWCPQIILWGD